MVAPADGVREQQACSAAARGVRRVAVGRARLEPERGPAAHQHGLAERHIDVDRLAVDVRPRPIRRRDRLGHGPAVRLEVAPAGGERAVRAGVGQREVRGVAGTVGDGAAVEGQGRRGLVVQVGGIVAPRDCVLEQQARRAGSPRVRRVAVGRARLEQERGQARDGHGLGKVHGNVDRLAGAVHSPARRRDRLDPGGPAVRQDSPVGRFVAGQREVRGVAGAVGDGAAVEGQGLRGPVEVRIVAPRDGVLEPDGRRAGSPRVRRVAGQRGRQRERGRAADRHGPRKAHLYAYRLAEAVYSPVRQRDRLDPGDAAVHHDSPHAERAGVGQEQERGVAGAVGDRAAVEGQGRPSRVVKGARVVSQPDGVLEPEGRRAGSRDVRRVAVRRARLELKRGRARDRHRL